MKTNSVTATADDGIRFSTLILIVLIGAGSALLLARVLPTWWPDLMRSLSGDQPKAFWYLSRASGFASYALIWLSMAFGLLITNRLARLWPGGPTAFDLHQYISLLGLGFVVFHVLILLGDRYLDYSLATLFVPFNSEPYRSFWVGLGQTGFYLSIRVSVTFYIRRAITLRAFRVIHCLSFAAFLLVLAHAIWSGTDSAVSWVVLAYYISGASLVFLTIYRVLSRWVRAGPHEAVTW